MTYENYIIYGNDIKCEKINIPFKTILSIFYFDKKIYLNFVNNYYENLLFLEKWFKIYIYIYIYIF